ncbi:N-acyl homoserine lactonase family protein [Actinomadura sp. 6N118]|uniref:N-acyl homoserine lactonase family protein n=1 Tax=Actinomadura sp. 6N118 TaxID=3375151 RepID=UPI003797C9BA
MTDVFRVYAICYGHRDARRGQHFHGCDERWDEPHPTAYYVWLAVSDQHTVVIDTGISSDRAEGLPGLDYVASPVAMLEQMGFAAGSVDHVVLTHLHYDHTGTADAFKEARYVVQQAELDYWTGPWAKRIERERWLVSDRDLDHLLKARDRLSLVDGDADVVPGLSVHLVGGHTAGMQIVRVRTASGHVVLASDASHFYENVEEDRPFAILHSMTGMYGAFDRIKELADGPIVPGHDPEVLRRFPCPLGDHVATVA